MKSERTLRHFREGETSDTTFQPPVAKIQQSFNCQLIYNVL